MHTALRAAMAAGAIAFALTPRLAAGDDAAGRPAAASFRRVETQRYTIEVPEGWEVGEETPFGQRELLPAQAERAGGGSMSTMTGPGLGRQSWADLYRTSNYFITRYSAEGQKMKPGPFRVGKTAQGYASCSWSMSTADGATVQRHVILKRADTDILALSVKLPAATDRDRRSQIEARFRHMVDTAVMR